MENSSKKSKVNKKVSSRPKSNSHVDRGAGAITGRKTSPGNKFKSSGSRNVSKSILEKLGRATTAAAGVSVSPSGNTNFATSITPAGVRWFECTSDVETNVTSGSGIGHDELATPEGEISNNGGVQNVELTNVHDVVDQVEGDVENVLINCPAQQTVLDLVVESNTNLHDLNELNKTDFLRVILEIQSSESIISSEVASQTNQNDTISSSQSAIAITSTVSGSGTGNLQIENNVNCTNNSNSSGQEQNKVQVERKLRRPGRHKVKVLENPTTSKKPNNLPEPQSPYRSEDFIDVDGKLKIHGKAFDTYVTREEYLLLKEFYVPGLIASSSSSSSRSRSRVRRFNNLVQMMNLSPISRSSPSRSPSPMSKSATVQNNTDKLNIVNKTHQLSSNTSELEKSTVKVIDAAQQTLLPPSVHTETQTYERGRRRTVEFDLDSNTIRSYEPDSMSHLNLSEITSSDSSITSTDLQILVPRSLETVSDPDMLAHDVFNDVKEEEILWEQKAITALRMTASILTAQEATTETVNSPTIQNVLNSLSFEEHQQLLDFVSNGRRGDTGVVEQSGANDIDSSLEPLLRLVDIYGCAYTQIVGHIETSNAYDSQFPYGKSRYHNQETQVSNQQRIDQSGEIEMVSLVETSVGDTKEVNEHYLQQDFEVTRSTDKTLRTRSASKSFLSYLPELTSDQFKIELRGNDDEFIQCIRLKDTTFRMKYGSKDVSTILTATRAKDCIIPISTGNLLLMHNQHSSLAQSRIVSSKYFMNLVLTKLTALGEQFISGKYAKALGEGKASIRPKLYRRLREINVFSGIIFQLSDSFVIAIKKMLRGMKDLKFLFERRPKSDPETDSVTLIGKPLETFYEDNHSEYTVPTTGILSTNESFDLLLSAFEDIDHTLITGSTSLRSLNQKKGGVIVRVKYYSTIVNFIDATKQLERGRDLDFGAVLLTFVVDTLMLDKLNGQSMNQTEPILTLEQENRIFENYSSLYYNLQELGKSGKKTCLISSFAASKSMFNLRRFRYAQEAPVGCFKLFEFSESRRQTEAMIEDKQGFQDIYVDGSSVEQEKRRLEQVLKAISNESCISSSVF